MKLRIRLGWIVGGWLVALAASALVPVWFIADKIERNPLGRYVDAETGAWTAHAYTQFLLAWLPIAVPVTLLAAACMFLNRPADPR